MSSICFDERLSAEAKKGFIVFLHAEGIRHQQDINDIHSRIKEVENYLELTPNERVELYRMGHKYVKI